jgi:tetratricopeptide (TPR) repeat protein
VADLLGSDPSLPPAKQFILAHAFTALNQANASLCTLMGVSSDENIAAWNEWTHAFQARHPQSAVAYYLLGDALARRGDLSGAIGTFTTGLQLDPGHQLLLNARGTAYAVAGNRQAARQDLLSGASGGSPLADAQVGAGSLIIDRKGGAADARSWFDMVLAGQQPDSALALYGRALTWVADSDWAKADADFQAALASAPCMAPLVATQLATLQEYLDGMTAVTAGEADADSGFALSRVIEPFLSDPSQRNANALLAYLAPNPQDIAVATSILRAHASGHPLWAANASQQLNQAQAQAQAWNVGFQPTLQTLSSIPNTTTWQPYAWANGMPNTIVVAATLPNTRNMATVANAQVASTLNQAVGTGVTPGGFDAGLHEARFDRGDWPAVTYYGLLYPVTTDRP